MDLDLPGVRWIHRKLDPVRELGVLLPVPRTRTSLSQAGASIAGQLVWYGVTSKALLRKVLMRKVINLKIGLIVVLTARRRRCALRTWLQTMGLG